MRLQFLYNNLLKVRIKFIKLLIPKNLVTITSKAISFFFLFYLKKAGSKELVDNLKWRANKGTGRGRLLFVKADHPMHPVRFILWLLYLHIGSTYTYNYVNLIVQTVMQIKPGSIFRFIVILWLEVLRN